MKKIIYGILVLFMGYFTSCTTFEDYQSETLADAPSINVATSEVKDSAFVITLTPTATTEYYAYAVVEEPKASKTIQGVDVLQKNVDGVKVETIKYGKGTETYTVKLNDLKPNTTYQVYASAANSDGIASEVVNASVLTTDELLPGLDKSEYAEGAFNLVFSEEVVLSTGELKLSYYKENDILNVVEKVVPKEDITVNGNQVTVKVPDTHPGEFVFLSWAADAFKDVFGNSIEAKQSGFTSAGKPVGVNTRVELGKFSIDGEKVTPKKEEAFQDWTKFEINYKFGHKVFKAEKGVVKLHFLTKGKMVTIDVPADKWGVSTTNDSTLFVKLPEEPEFGTWVDFTVEEGAVTDVYGSPVEKYESQEGFWIYSYGYTRDLVLSDYTFTGESLTDSKKVTFDLSVTKGKEDNEVNIAGMFSSTAETVTGTFDGDKGTITVTAWSALGLWDISGTKYNTYLIGGVEGDDAVDLVLTVQSDGTLTTNSMAAYLYDESDKVPVGFYKNVKGKFTKK